MQSLDWQCLFENKTIDTCTEEFYRHVLKALSYILTNIVKHSSKEKPWITVTIKVLINKRFDAYRKRNWPLYYHYRNKVKRAISDAKKSWGSRMCKAGKSPWNIYKTVVNSNVNADWLLKCCSDNNVKRALDFLCGQYVSVMINDAPIYQPMPFVVPFQFQESEIFECLQHVNPRSGIGADGIPSIAWSKFASPLCVPLCMLFNACLLSADLP